MSNKIKNKTKKINKTKLEQKKQEKLLQKKGIKFNANFVIGIFTLLIMVFSIMGFALMSGTASNKASSSNNKEFRLRYLEDYGVWGAYLNGEEFIFKNIYQFKNLTNIENIANRIKQTDNLQLYIDPNFDKSSSFIIKKSLKGIRKDYFEVYNFQCDAGTLVLTNNMSVSGECIIFSPEINETYDNSEALMYYLVK